MSDLDRYRPLASDRVQVQTQDATPACVLTWVNKPDGTIRLYASREIPPQGWGQRTTEGGQVDWHLETTLRNVLIVDRPTPAEAIAWVLERWLREDAERERRLHQHAIAGQKALEGGPEPFTRGLPSL